MSLSADPLIEALPPATDYITYLTILEYQLTAARLPILTRLLSEDDGTLASEIGWDLVQLVLRLFSDAPGDAAACLEVVARRGNPREVVIRVAEALESLGVDHGEGLNHSGSDQQFDEESEDGNSLQIFKGEAEGIHLGTLRLDGGPPEDEQEHATAIEVENRTSSLQFQTLVAMLSILHPRIKTKHPSRFLATSLPAALGAYRRISITNTTTSSFLTFLGKVSGKQRPALPPRASTATSSQPPGAPKRSEDVVAPPLPDPEAQSETKPEFSPSQGESAIILRLIQAVTLEVLDEYVLSLASLDPNSMSWTLRLREKFQPERAILNRQSETTTWEHNGILRERTATNSKFLRLSKDLNLDVNESFRSILESSGDDRGADPDDIARLTIEDEDGDRLEEFPTNPSQIPFPPFGVLFLYAARQATSNLASSSSYATENTNLDIFPTISHLFSTFSAQSPAGISTLSSNPVPVLDALLAILYISTHFGKTGLCSNEEFAQFFMPLAYLCAESYDPHIRDSAHAVATKLLHRYPDPVVRLAIIKNILSSAPATNLAEVAVEWLKDEILAAADTVAEEPAQRDTAATIQMQETSSPPRPQPPATTSPKNPFTDPSLLSNTNTWPILHLLFPTPDDADGDLDTFIVKIPFYIASLNLLYVVLSAERLRERYHAAQLFNEEEEEECSAKVLLDRFEAWVGRVKGQQGNGQEGGGAGAGFELWSLEDAFHRVKTLIAAIKTT